MPLADFIDASTHLSPYDVDVNLMHQNLISHNDHNYIQGTEAVLFQCNCLAIN